MRSVLMALLFLMPPDDPSRDRSASTPDERYRSLFQAWDADWQGFLKASREARTEEDWEAVNNHPGRRPSDHAAGFMALAREYPGTAAAEDSLVWVASHVMFGRETEEAKRLLIRDHIRSAQLAPVFAFQYWTCGSEATERLLRETLTRNPRHEMRGLACYWLAQYLMQQAAQSRVAKRGGRVLPPPEGVVVEGWGPDYVDRLRRLDPEALDREAEALLARVAEDYANIPHNDQLRPPGRLGDAAIAHLHSLRDLAVGKPAPEVVGDDLEGRKFRLSDYRGRVVVLDFGSHFFCGPCRALYPEQRTLVERLEGRPFALVTIDADEDREAVKQAWQVEGNSWRCVFDGPWGGPINSAWNIQKFPTLYVIDHRGTIRYKDVTGQALADAVDELLKESEAAKDARE